MATPDDIDSENSELAKVEDSDNCNQQSDDEGEEYGATVKMDDTELTPVQVEVEVDTERGEGGKESTEFESEKVGPRKTVADRSIAPEPPATKSVCSNNDIEEEKIEIEEEPSQRNTSFNGEPVSLSDKIKQEGDPPGATSETLHPKLESRGTTGRTKVEARQGNTELQPKPPPPSNGRPNANFWSWVIGILFIIVALLLAILVTTILLYIQAENEEDDESNLVGSNDTLPPTEFPSRSPTSPTIEDSRAGCPVEFVPIQSDSNSFIQELSFASADSGQKCPDGIDSCVVEVTLPFAFQWLSQTFRTVYVSPNGHVKLQPNCNTLEDCGTIEAARARVNINDRVDFEGRVLVMRLDNAWVVAWENIEFVGTTHVINAHLTIYADGAVDICWGEGNAVFPIRAGIWFYALFENYVYPDTLYPFDNDGNLASLETEVSWPGEQCHYYRSADSRTAGWGFEEQTCLEPSTNSCQNSFAMQQLPFQTRQQLVPQSPVPDYSEVQAMSCPAFDLTTIEEPTLWFSFEGDGSCLCVELRSIEAPFRIALFQSATECNDLRCMAETDFTSSSTGLQTAVGQQYRIVVTSFGSPVPGTFALTVIRQVSAACPRTPNSVFSISGSCGPHVSTDQVAV